VPRNAASRKDSLRCVDPGIQQRDSCALVVTGVAGYHRQPMVKGGCRDDQVRLQVGLADLAPVFIQQAPLEHDVLGDFKHALVEHGPDFVRQPIMHLGAPDRITRRLDAVANLGYGRRTDEQFIQRLAGDKTISAPREILAGRATPPADRPLQKTPSKSSIGPSSLATSG